MPKPFSRARAPLSSAAVVTMVTLGQGATRMVSDQISSLGSNLLMVRPGQRLGPGRDSAGAPNFKKADAEAIRTQLGGLQEVVPVVGHAITLVVGNNNWSSTVNGTTNGYLVAGNWKLAAGRAFLDDEERNGKRGCSGQSGHREVGEDRPAAPRPRRRARRRPARRVRVACRRHAADA